ncbi:MAG: FadR/GntR family transcriptional regulator [Pseudomonadota bacterium]|nr:FadR/GntR family transcriptional regulator [Pseudomonadota bacterium]
MPNRRMYQNIADQIRGMISSGAYPPGNRLPGERELAEKFGVSRVIIREAEIALEALGYIEIRVGSGAYVLKPKNSREASPPAVSAFELTQFRLLFEPECAALAATAISEQDLKRLEATVERMVECADDQQAAEEADRDFHLSIARSTGNSAIEYFVEQMWQIRSQVDEVRKVYSGVCEKDASARVDEHSLILEAIRNRDPEGARAAMRQHFTRLLEALLEQSERLAIEEAMERSRANRDRFLRGLEHVNP